MEAPVCTNCGSRQLAFIDVEGRIVCEDCGIVVAEGVAEDYCYSPPRTSEEGVRPGMGIRKSSLKGFIHGSTARRALARTLRLGRVFDGSGRIVSYADHVAAERVEREGEEFKALYRALRESRIARGRSERVVLGLAYYVAFRSRGLSSSESLRKASAASMSSKTTLAKILAKYKLEVEEFIREQGFEAKAGVQAS